MCRSLLYPRKPEQLFLIQVIGSSTFANRRVLFEGVISDTWRAVG